MDDIKKTLAERGTRYGSFRNNADTAQDLKAVICRAYQVNTLKKDQIEALELICTKISRIVNGDCNYKDNWVDIAGYATLVADNLKDE